MRPTARFSAFLAAAAALCFFACFCAVAASAQSSSSQTSPQVTPAQKAAAQTAGNGAYIAVNPLAGVRYNNRYDVSVSMAYDHMKAGPNLLQGSNLGGLVVDGSYWLTKRWGVEGSFRPYVGTSGAAPNDQSINGPFVSEYFYTGGPEWLGPHNQHGDLIAHVLVGGVTGNFQQDLRGNPPSVVGFYNNQTALAMVMGGHFDLNRSAHWVFRMTPDAVLTDYGVNWGNHSRQIDINAAFSVGVEYKFLGRKR
ncbi:MAG: hypothetical protein ACRD3N_00935 [Terracidiphilus sp.]